MLTKENEYYNISAVNFCCVYINIHAVYSIFYENSKTYILSVIDLNRKSHCALEYANNKTLLA